MKMLARRLFSWLLFGAACAVALALGAQNAFAAPTPITHGTLELISEKQWIEPGHLFDLGLRFELEKGWHIYWVNPGDSGEPPRVEWELPKGVSAGEIEWPTPRRLGLGSVVDYGYEGSVLLIVPMRAAGSLAAQHTVRVGAEVKLLVCSNQMCIPGKASLSIALPLRAGTAPDGEGMGELFDAARRNLPRATPTSWEVSVTDEKGDFVITINQGRAGAAQANFSRRVAQAIFFPLDEMEIDNAAAQEVTPATGGFRVAVKKSNLLQKPVARLKGVMVIDGEGYLVDAAVAGGSGGGSGALQ